MNIPNYPSNNKTKPNEKKKITPVVKGRVKVKKNLKGLFLSDDIGSVAKYVVNEIVIPTAKRMAMDVITMGADRLINGENSANRSTSSILDNRYGARPTYVSYDKISSAVDRFRRVEPGYVPEDITFDFKSDAEAVLRCMDEIVDQYRVITVLEYKELCRATPTHTDNKYGWTSLATARVEVTRGGRWYIRLPRPTPI